MEITSNFQILDIGLQWTTALVRWRGGGWTDNVPARNPFVTILSGGCVLKCFTSVIGSFFPTAELY